MTPREKRAAELVAQCPAKRRSGDSILVCAKRRDHVYGRKSAEQYHAAANGVTWRA